MTETTRSRTTHPKESGQILARLAGGPAPWDVAFTAWHSEAARALATLGPTVTAELTLGKPLIADPEALRIVLAEAAGQLAHRNFQASHHGTPSPEWLSAADQLSVLSSRVSTAISYVAMIRNAIISWWDGGTIAERLLVLAESWEAIAAAKEAIDCGSDTHRRELLMADAVAWLQFAEWARQVAALK